MGLLSSKETDSDNEMASDFYFPTSKKALLIFTRNPELGKVKTRLAKSIGDESALKIYKFLLDHTVEITKDLNVDKYVFYSEDIHRNDIWDATIFRKKLQTGDDLGERMKNAFSEILGMGYEKAIIIGSDMFDMDKNDLNNAYEALQTNQFVLGPATDGGYYLLGMKELNSDVFQNKNWGTDTVLKATLLDLRNEKYVLLEERNDIDYYQDIRDEAAFQQFLPPYLDNDFL
ncbi:TIGR04282 family arsenosugar biosynthesis glycosyltransferase [Aequorivita capsosiphonis]|uniref:TIGR04282 family arsenosugar biosynthesis glycosyltransferase n=1 Tax=Aequorivita capsosiphonis TaxID=487317 RepID=UPI0003FAD053|nr:TIGR04282 family arsenosugar biosynthesis glycosyltransferase [Aequorivita capsosiphonis]